MVDFNNTAYDWAITRSDLLFLPVGALEQHGDHLPINTDCRQAEYFSRKLAEHFNAALLPCIPIASSLEHTGWRGAFTLKPETLINIIRDIAENAEMQNYTTLVIISGHGGNFPLGPACREWNRRDRKLKLILMHPYDHGAKVFKSERMDLHAGQAETSIMRYICQENFPFEQTFTTGNTSTLKQSDLNTFGVGWLNANGVPGHPEDADIELGRKITDAIISGSIAELEERLALLARNRRYCGKGGLYLRKCTAQDIQELQQLSESVSWNQLPADWNNFIELGGVWSMIHLNRITGTAAWIPRGKDCVWIGLVITRPEWRGYSIASRLMQKILDETGDCSCRLLDASAMGAPVYRKLGFKDMYTVSRFALCGASPAPTGNWQPMSLEDMKTVSGDDPLAGRLYNNAPELCHVLKNDGKIEAWFMGRYGLNSIHIGPLYAKNSKDALDAVSKARRLTGGTALTIDVMGYQNDFTAEIIKNGAERKRDFLRMYHGTCNAEQNPEMFAAAGPEYG